MSSPASSAALAALSKGAKSDRNVLGVLIHQWKLGMERFAQTMTKHHRVRVRFQGSEAHTDGTTIVVPDAELLSKPALTTDELNERRTLLNAMRGYLWHEMLHVIHSDSECSLWRSEVKKHGEKFKDLNNALEDIRIELSGRRTWPGAAEALNFLRFDYVWPRMTKQLAELRASGEEPCLFRQTIFGLQVIGFFPSDYKTHELWKALDPRAQERAEACADLVSQIEPASHLAKVEGTVACVETSVAVWERLKERSEPEDEEESTVTIALDPGEAISEDMKSILAELGEALEHKDPTCTTDEDFSPYVVYTREGDRVGERPQDAAHEVGALRTEVQEVCGPVQRRLQLLLRSQTRTRVIHDRPEGKLDTPGLYKLAAGNTRVFKEHRQRLSLDNTVVGLLVDVSGSMTCDGKIKLARQAAFAFGECLHTIRLPFGLWSFTSGHDFHSSSRRYRSATPDEQKVYGRWGDVYFETAKDFDESWDRTRRYVPRMGSHRSQNHDGEAVQWATVQLLLHKRPRKVLFVLSDGMPATGEPGKAEALQRAHLHRTIKLARKQGVEVVGIGIKTDAPTLFYGKRHSVVVHNLSELPGVVLGQLSAILQTNRNR